MKTILSLLALLCVLVATPALASNCSSYPYTLTNGTTADANQVMSNFNTVLSCANNNLAANGANSDITSLTGLTTPLAVGEGGTGVTTLQLPAVYNNSGSAFTPAHMVIGHLNVLSTGTTVTLTGAAVFTSTATFVCTASDASGNISGEVSYALLSGSSVRLFNSNSGQDTSFVCVGD